MSGNAVRREAIWNVEAYVPPAISFNGAEAPGEIFGLNVFSKTVMQKRLPKSVYKSVIATIEHGAPVRDPEHSYGQVRAAARSILPGARWRRHLYWRYSLVWQSPA